MESNEKHTAELSLVVKDNGMSIPRVMHTALMDGEAAMKWAGAMAKEHDMIPKHLHDKPAKIIGVVQYGLSIGMDPYQAMQDVVPTNGMMSLKGDAALARVRASGQLEKWEVIKEGSIDNEDYKVTIKYKRVGMSEGVESFSVAQAKRAGLWITPEDVKKDYKKGFSPWYKYPERLMYYRPMGYIMRDVFGDIIKSPIVEEARDYSNVIDDQEAQVLQSTVSKGQKAVDVLAQSYAPSKTTHDDLKSDEYGQIEAEEVKAEPVNIPDPNQTPDPQFTSNRSFLSEVDDLASFLRNVDGIDTTDLVDMYEKRFGEIDMGYQSRKTHKFMQSVWQTALLELASKESNQAALSESEEVAAEEDDLPFTIPDDKEVAVTQTIDESNTVISSNKEEEFNQELLQELLDVESTELEEGEERPMVPKKYINDILTDYDVDYELVNTHLTEVKSKYTSIEEMIKIAPMSEIIDVLKACYR